MDNIFVKPALDADGNPLLVRHPAKGYAALPAEGDYWPQGTYTTRRLRDGDVVEAEPPVAEPQIDEGTGEQMEPIQGVVGETTEVFLESLSGLPPEQALPASSDVIDQPEPATTARKKRGPFTEV